MVLQCYALLLACLLAVLTYGEALSDHIVSYRDILCDIVSYRIVSLMAVCHHYTVVQNEHRRLKHHGKYGKGQCCEA